MIGLPPELNPASALLLVIVSFFASAISTAFGIGGGIAMLAALLTVVSPIHALPVHAVIQAGSNAGHCWVLRRKVMRTLVLWFVPGSILGILVASQFLIRLPVAWLQLALAIFIVWAIWTPRVAVKPVADSAYLAIGACSSFLTMFLGATGPILAAFLSPSRYGRDRTVATHAACMTLQHGLKIFAFGFLGFSVSSWIPMLVAMILSGFAGTLLGGKLLRRIPEHQFRWVFKIVLTLLALRLIWATVKQWA